MYRPIHIYIYMYIWSQSHKNGRIHLNNISRNRVEVWTRDFVFRLLTQISGRCSFLCFIRLSALVFIKWDGSSSDLQSSRTWKSNWSVSCAIDDSARFKVERLSIYVYGERFLTGLYVATMSTSNMYKRHLFPVSKQSMVIAPIS